MLDLLADLNRTAGRTIVVVLHDLNLACRYAHHLVAMRGGRIVAAGAPADVITEDTVREVFGLDSVVIPDPISGTPLVVPYSGVTAPMPTMRRRAAGPTAARALA